jgi:hypothetical protein
VRSLFPPYAVRDGLPPDRRGQFLPQYIRNFGFRVQGDCVPACRDFRTSAGRATGREDPQSGLRCDGRCLPPATDESRGLRRQVYVVNLYTGGTESIVLKNCDSCRRDRNVLAQQ